MFDPTKKIWLSNKNWRIENYTALSFNYIIRDRAITQSLGIVRLYSSSRSPHYQLRFIVHRNYQRRGILTKKKSILSSKLVIMYSH